MGIDVNVINKIVELAENKVIEYGGEALDGKSLRRIDRKTTEALKTFSLDGVVSATAAAVLSKKFTLPLLVNIVNPFTVQVESSVDDRKVSDDIVSANFSDDTVTRCAEKFLSYEEAMIKISTCFAENEDLKALREQLSKLTDNNTVTLEDDGITQSAQVKSGVSLKAESKLRSKFTLQPYRTFGEIEQPASVYLLRVSDKREVGLFKCDGRNWELEAIKNIRTYLDNQFRDKDVIDSVVII